MAKYLITDTLLNDLADAVSAKTGEDTPLTIAEMTTAVGNIVFPSGSTNITTNGTHNVTAYETAVVNVPSETPTLQTKTKTYTPTTSQQTETVIADSGYDGLSQVNVTVGAMPTMTLPSATTTTETGIRKADIFPSTITTTFLNIPAGYNSTAQYYRMRALMLDSKPITSNGTYTALDDDLDGYSSVTVNVSGGTDFVITLSYNDTTQMWEPNKTFAEIVQAYSDSKDVGITTGVIGATVGCEYDSHYNRFVYMVCIDDGSGVIVQVYLYDANGLSLDDEYRSIYPVFETVTKTYTPSASTQTETVTYDSNNYNGLQQVNVTVNAMPSGTAGTPIATKGTVSNHSVSVTPSVTNTTGYIAGGTKTGTAVTVSANELVSGSQTLTANDTYDVTNLASVTVNVGGESKNAQTVQSTTRTTSTSYTRISGEITVAKTGTYDVYWTATRSSTSGTWGTQLYIGSSSYGAQQTSYSNHVQNVHLSNVSLTAGQTVSVRGRSRGNGYYAYVPMLTIIEA